MKLSDQAIGTIMMALQKSLMEQADIVPMLKEMNFAEMDNKELLVENPPDIKIGVPIKTPVAVEMQETENPYFLYGSKSNKGNN